jgi:hypothetical protein
VGVITEVNGRDFWGQQEYYVEYETNVTDTQGGDYVKEDDIVLVEKNMEPPRMCECGAHVQQGFEDFHAPWCRMYKDKRY